MTELQPQPQIRTVNPAKQPTQSNSARSSILVSEKLSTEIYKFLLELGEKLRNQGKRILTDYDIFLALVAKAQYRQRLIELKIEPRAAEEAAIRYRTAQAEQVTFSGKVIFSPDARALILNACIKAGNNEFVELDHLWQASLEIEALQLAIKGSNPLINKSESTDKRTRKTAGSIADVAPNVAKLCEDLTLEAQKTNTRPIVGREKELNQILRIITREEKSSVLLIGENGVGKSAIVEGLAFELVHNSNVPANLAAYRILKINFSSLIASAEYPGSNLPEFMEELSKLGKLILFIEGIRFSEISQEGFALNSFLNLVFRNKEIVVLIGAEPSFYRSTLEKNELFNENFDIVQVSEPDKNDLANILAIKAQELQTAQNISISPELLTEIIELCKRYLASLYFPQKAIALLEESFTATAFAGSNVVESETIRRVLSEKIGIPLQSISVTDREKLIKLDENLRSVVIGQNQAVSVVVEAIKRSRAGLKDQKKPIGSFLFLGPSGVGKTELAKQLANIYYDDERAFVRLDMSEYGEQHTSQRLIGSPPGYTGYEEGGQFTNPIQQKPYSLILLDEIEKAHPKIFDIFLQVLDEGRLTDSRGKLADYRNAILIFTSNIASDAIFKDLSSENSQFKADKKQFLENQIMPELLRHFRPEFINRFDEIVPFNPLVIEDLLQIAKLKIKRIQNNLLAKQIALVTPDEELIKMVTAAYDPRFGARPIERSIKDYIETPIAQQIISADIPAGTVINWKYTP